MKRTREEKTQRTLTTKALATMILITITITLLMAGALYTANTTPNQQPTKPTTTKTPTPIDPITTKLWNYTTGGLVESSACVADLFGNGKLEVIVGSDDSRVYCLNGTTGHQVWNYTTGNVVSSSACVADLFGNGKPEVIVGSDDSRVYCLNGTTGHRVWSCPTSGSVSSSACVADLFGNGKLEVVIGSQDHNVYCLNGTTGQKVWSYPTGGLVYSSPCVADLFGNGKPEVIVGSEDSRVYCLNGTTGHQVWNYTTGLFVDSSPCVADLFGNGKLEVVIGSQDHNVYCLNGTTGHQVWSYKTGNVIWSSACVADLFGNGKPEVIVGSEDSRVYCLNGTTGHQVWNYTTGNVVSSSACVADLFGNGKLEVVVGSCDDSVYCLNGTTGHQVWSYPTGNVVISSPRVADLFGNGKHEVIVGSDDHNVYCLNGAIPPPPAAIGDLAAGSPVTNTSVPLTWTAPGASGMDGNATGYAVEYSTSGPINASNWGSATTYAQSWVPAKNGTTETHEVTGLAPGTKYWFAVEAYNTHWSYGGVSNSPSATTIKTAPSSPQNLQASAGIGWVALSWSAPISNGGSAVTGYKVYRGTSSGGETLLNTLQNITTYSDTAVTNGQTYYYEISAVNGVGEGAKSVEVHATLPNVPSAPQNLQASAGNECVVLTWAAPISNGGSAVREYYVYRGTSSGGETLFEYLLNVTTYNDTFVTGGQTYYYEVSASNFVGEGAKSGEVHAIPRTAPSAPASLDAHKTGIEWVILTWTAPSWNGGFAVTGYRVYRGTSSGGETLLATVGNVTTYNDTAVTGGQTYYYEVSAVNGVGEGAKSVEVFAMAPTVPSAPASISVQGGFGWLALNWTASSNGGSAVTGYKVYRGTSSGGETLLATVGNVTTYNDTAVTGGQTYYYEVSAVNGVGEGAKSVEIGASPSYESSGGAIIIVGGAVTAVVVVVLVVVVLMKKRKGST